MSYPRPRDYLKRQHIQPRLPTDEEARRTVKQFIARGRWGDRKLILDAADYRALADAMEVILEQRQ